MNAIRFDSIQFGMCAGVHIWHTRIHQLMSPLFAYKFLFLIFQNGNPMFTYNAYHLRAHWLMTTEILSTVDCLRLNGLFDASGRWMSLLAEWLVQCDL